MTGNRLSSDIKAKIGFSLGILAGFAFLLLVFAALGDSQLVPALAGLWAGAWLIAQIPLLISMRRDRPKKAYAKKSKG